MTIIASFKPARLKALEAEVTAPPREETVSHGTNSTPGNTSGPWISSEITHAPCSSAAAAIATSSARVGTRPVGLCGLQSSSARAPAANAEAMPSTSRAPEASSGTSTTRRRACGMSTKYGG